MPEAKAKAKAKKQPPIQADPNGLEAADTAESDGRSDEDLLPEGKLVCALTGEQLTANAQEETLQSFIEQLHREYEIPFEDMGRDVRIQTQTEDPKTGKTRTRTRVVSLAVYEAAKAHSIENIIRVAVVSSAGTKPDEKAIGVLEEVLAGLSEEREQVFGLWTNGIDLAFRMRTYHVPSQNLRSLRIFRLPTRRSMTLRRPSADRSASLQPILCCELSSAATITSTETNPCALTAPFGSFCLQNSR
jgi:hypothetical protein